MQTLSYMQRSITYKNYIAPFYYAALFFIYSALSGIYLFLPPLLVILFVLFSKSIKDQNQPLLMLTIFCLVLFESQYEYVLLSTAFYFSILHYFVIPKLEQTISCITCNRIIIVTLIYIGFYLFYNFFAGIFSLPLASINYFVIYYAMVEFFIVSLL